MALTNSSRFFETSIQNLSNVLEDFTYHFEGQGYSVTTEPQPAGAFGQQILPSALTLLVAWPVIIPQIMGLVQQSKLDTEAYNVIESSLRKYEDKQNQRTTPREEFEFCTSCGAKNAKGMTFCPICGTRMMEEELHCISCGKVIPKGTAFCMFCGTKQ